MSELKAGMRVLVTANTHFSVTYKGETGILLKRVVGRWMVKFDKDSLNTYNSSKFGKASEYVVYSENIERIGIKATNLAKRMYPDMVEKDGYLYE